MCLQHCCCSSSSVAVAVVTVVFIFVVAVVDNAAIDGVIDRWCYFCNVVEVIVATLLLLLL